MKAKVTRIWAAAAVLGLAIAACGGGDDGPNLGDLADPGAGSDSDSGNADLGLNDEDLEDFADAVNQATGAGGGGTLTFDGVEHPIDSVTCFNTPERIDIGTVGPDGYRVFVSGDPTDLNLQILSPESVQWFDGDPMQANKPTVTVDGNIVTSTGGTFFNNQDDTLIVAEFTIECP